MKNKKKFPTILVIDTSSSVLSLALASGDKMFEKSATLLKTKQSDCVLFLLQDLLTEAAIDFIELDAIAFAAGPGSFTGVRLAASIAKTIAYVEKINVIPIPTPQIIAQSLMRTKNAKFVIIIEQARQDEVYFAAYKLNAKGIMEETRELRVMEVKDIAFKDFARESEGWLIYGSAQNHFREIILQKAKEQNLHFVFVEEIKDNSMALDLVFLAKEMFEQGKTVSALEALPIYLQDETAWRR